MRIGIFGGTFDPIHLGHLRTAIEIAENLSLEKVYMIPSAQPPHRAEAPAAEFSHRLEMVKRAVFPSELLGYLDLEGKRNGPSYSIDTLRELYKLFGENTEFFFIIGCDAFLEIKSWKEYKHLFEYANFVVVGRGEQKRENFEAYVTRLKLASREKEGSNTFMLPSGKKMMFKITTRMDISSTRIRKTAARGGTIHFLVPNVVNEYIKENKLY